ncbi:MAG: hypothetical protein WKF81_13655, partial [Thermomicrobiales bacterium]
WGECHAPLAPRATAAIVLDVLAPILIGQDPLSIELLWKQMYGSWNPSFQCQSVPGGDDRAELACESGRSVEHSQA